MHQLETLLIAMAEDSPEHGITILHHLSGFSPREMAESRESNHTNDGPFSLRLLSELCKPTSGINIQRYAQLREGL